jgi:hypothetical protein
LSFIRFPVTKNAISTSRARPRSAFHPLVRDALIQATLDPLVRSIEFVPSARVHQAQVDVNAIVLVRDDGRYLLDIVTDRPLRELTGDNLTRIGLQQLGLRSIVLTAADIQREPRFANARLVWSHRLAPVGLTMRMSVLQVLLDDGPMTLGRLLSSIRSDRDPSPAIMAMACSNLLALDLVSQPLSPMTVVRSLS